MNDVVDLAALRAACRNAVTAQRGAASQVYDEVARYEALDVLGARASKAGAAARARGYLPLDIQRDLQHVGEMPAHLFAVHTTALSAASPGEDGSWRVGLYNQVWAPAWVAHALRALRDLRVPLDPRASFMGKLARDDERVASVRATYALGGRHACAHLVRAWWRTS